MDQDQKQERAQEPEDDGGSTQRSDPPTTDADDAEGDDEGDES